MAKVLGIDLGTNSLGWALINTETNEIIKTGVRIFPEGVNKDQSGSESPKNVERRMARGVRKSNFRYKLRRNRLIATLKKFGMMPDKRYYTIEKNRNYKQIEGKKIKIKRNFSFELYELRYRALNEKLSLEEIGRIFLQLNNHRGFKSNAKEKAELEFNNDEKKKEEQGKVAKSASQLSKKIEEAKANNQIQYGTLGEYFFYLIKCNSNFYNINEPISKIRNNDEGEGHYTLREMFEYEFDLIWNKQKYFYKEDYIGKEIFTDDNKKRIKEGCIFFQRNLRSVKHLISKCPLEFTTYKKNEQGKIITEKSYLRCCPKSSFLFQEFRIWDTISNLRYKQGDADWLELNSSQKNMLAEKLQYLDTLFLNKPDRRFKSLSKEEKKKIEENLKKLLQELELPKDALFNITKINGNRTVSRIAEALGKEYWEALGKTSIENYFEFIDEITGEVIKLNFPRLYSDKQEAIWHLIYFSSQFSNSQDWLLGKKKFKNQNLINTYQKLGLNQRQINSLSTVVLEPGYGAYSSKALNKLVPFLKSGFNKYSAETMVYDNAHSDIRVNDDNLLHTIPLLPSNYLRNPIVQQGANEAIRLINSIIKDESLGKPDEIRIEFTRELKKPKELRESQKRRNDEREAEKIRYAAFLSRKLNQFISKDDDRILKFELFLELDWSKKAFEEIKDGIDIADFMEFVKNVDDDRIKDYQKKYDLWLECGRRLPYTGEVIKFSQLFSPEIEIEHIIPYSRCFDDSFANKTLSSKSFNVKKGNQTPLEYFESRPKAEIKDFELLIKNFPESKRKRFLMKSEEVDDFKNSQLNNTAYSVRLLSEQLRKSFRADQIKITNGAVTSIIRNLFGFNTLLNQPIRVPGYENGRYWVVFDEDGKFYTLFEKTSDNEPKVEKGHTLTIGYVNNEHLRIGKTRNDNRHHAVDAIAIAYTNQRIIQFISTITEGYYFKNGKRLNHDEEGAEFIKAFDENGSFTKEVWEKIAEEAKKHYDIKTIRHDARQMIKEILTSYRSSLKLTSSGKKKVYLPTGKPMKVKNGEGKEVPFYSGGDVARGKLHEATLYGKIIYNQPKDKEKRGWAERDGIFVYRVPLKYSTTGFFSNIEQLDKIVDPVIRKLAKESAEEKGLKQALTDGIFLPNTPKKNDSKDTIRKPVRVKHVRIVNDSKDLNIIRSYIEQKKDYKKAYVETGENYKIAIYGDYECNNRDYSNITLLEAAKNTALNNKRRKTGSPPLPLYASTKKGLVFLMILSKGDLVIVYDKHPDEIDVKIDDKEKLFKRLFRVIKSDKNGIIVLGRHNLANIKADKDRPVKDINSLEGSVIRRNYKTVKCIKVEVDELGNISISKKLTLFDESGETFSNIPTTEPDKSITE